MSKMKKERRSVALFGGSFNPPHEGHFEMARRVAGRSNVDAVWILPVYRHPFGKKVAPFGDRLRQCRTLFRPLAPKVTVMDLERRLGGVSWTVRLLKHLRKKHPFTRFFWVMGADAYAERRDWKEFPEIRKLVRLIVFPRGKESPIPNVSSTEIRARTPY